MTDTYLRPARPRDQEARGCCRRCRHGRPRRGRSTGRARRGGREGTRNVRAGEAYSLTPVARVALDSAYSRLYAAQRNDEAFIAAYQRFEAINGDLKQLMTAWQTIEIDGESVLNDHTNKDYDDKPDRPPRRLCTSAPRRFFGNSPPACRALRSMRKSSRSRWKRQKTARPNGSAARRSSPITRCGSSFMRTCCASSAARGRNRLGLPSAAGPLPSTARRCRTVRLSAARHGASPSMRHAGLPVPPAFVVTTEACRAYLADGRTAADGSAG